MLVEDGADLPLDARAQRPEQQAHVDDDLDGPVADLDAPGRARSLEAHRGAVPADRAPIPALQTTRDVGEHSPGFIGRQSVLSPDDDAVLHTRCAGDLRTPS